MLQLDILDEALFRTTACGGKVSVCSVSAKDCLLALISPAGWLTGKRNSKQVEEALPEGPLFHYNPSKWNQSGTMHPTVASKRSPHLSLSLVHKSFPLWRPSHLKSAVSHWQDKVATVFLIAMLIYRQRVSCLYKKRTLLQIAFFLYMCLKEGKDV